MFASAQTLNLWRGQPLGQKGRTTTPLVFSIQNLPGGCHMNCLRSIPIVAAASVALRLSPSASAITLVPAGLNALAPAFVPDMDDLVLDAAGLPNPGFMFQPGPMPNVCGRIIAMTGMTSVIDNQLARDCNAGAPWDRIPAPEGIAVSIPEPASALLLGLGLASLVFIRRKR